MRKLKRTLFLTLAALFLALPGAAQPVFDDVLRPVFDSIFSPVITGGTSIDSPGTIFSFDARRESLVDSASGNYGTFARASTATFFNKLGAWQLAAINQPRYSADGIVLEGGATNKVTCAKSNPSDLTNISKSGDAAAVLSVVNDAPALASAGLSAFGPNVYKLDNSAGTSAAFAAPLGTTGNTNSHSLSAYVKGTGTAKVRIGSGTAPNISLTSVYARVKTENITPVDSGRGLIIEAAAGSVVYFTLPQLEEGPVCTSPIPGGTGAITRASEGSDTSNNGLTMPLSQAMIDSLKGEMIDWSTAWAYSANPSYYSISGKTITCASGADVIRVASKSGALTTDQVYEISYTVSGLAGGSMRAFFGASGNAATVGLPVISSDGTYIGRDIATNGTTLGVRFNAGATGSVTVNYCRRVLESGQTNPGEGTVLCGVYLAWSSSSVPNSSWINLVTSINDITSFLALRKDSGGTFFPRLYDGVSVAEGPKGPIGSNYYVFLAQFSARTAQMRVGLYNPATGALTWGNYVTYRGFFPISTTGGQRMRFFYGGGAFPIYVKYCKWYGTLLTDGEIKSVIN